MGPMIGLLALIRAEPTLLPPAPEAALVGGAHMDHRRLDEVQTCLGCGQRAECAFVAETKLGPRWLDLCHACTYRLQEEDSQL
ncbi:hypothetical protein ABZ671_18675 [Micromonospora sp. NPDC006766]|uniref:hypothetical protein n=1 Tax=Micromonospora sp. NPDC006766 TaxID=3154778 RepID=UPI0033E645AF